MIFPAFMLWYETLYPTSSSNPESPVPHLFDSNAAPSESEVKIIQEAIVRMEENIITNMAGSFSGPNQFVSMHKALLSPIRRLPDDILCEIFSHFVPSHSYALRSPRCSEVPWRLGHICRRWREVAMSLPFLWNRIPTINLTKPFVLSDPSYIEFLTRLIMLSGSTPRLGVYVYCHFKKISSHPIIDLLVEHSERIEHLVIWSRYTTLSAFQGIKGRLPHLRMLALTLFSENEPTVDIDIFEVAPELRDVRILRVKGIQNGNLKLPQSPFIHYKEELTDNGDTLHQVLVSSAESLTSLSINVLTPTDFPDIDIPPTTLNHVVNLDLILDDVPGHIQVLDKITVPRLANLKVISSGYFVPRLTLLLLRSGLPSPLRTLIIFRASLRPGELISLLRLTPQLIFLHAKISSADDLISHDSVTSINSVKQPPLVPMLRTLLMHCDEVEGLQEAIAALTYSRCELIKTGDVKRLDNLRITLPVNAKVERSQDVLNSWTESAASNSINHEFALFRKLRQTLSEHAYTLDAGPPTKKLDQALRAIENHDVHSVEALIKSRLPVSLWNIIDKPSMTILKDDKYYLKERAQKTLKRWQPGMMKCIPRYTWARRISSNTLVYIPSDDPLRRSSNAIDIIYGLNLDDRLPDTPCNIFEHYPSHI